MGAFEMESGMDPKTAMLLNVALFAVVLGGYAVYLVKAFSGKKE